MAKWRAENLERETAAKAYALAHPDVAAAKKAREDADWRATEARWAKESAARAKYEEAYYRRTGHYPGQGRRRAQPKGRSINGTAYREGMTAGDRVNLQPHLDTGKEASRKAAGSIG